MLSATEPKNETAKSESASAKRRSVVSGCVVSESSSRAADSSAASFLYEGSAERDGVRARFGDFDGAFDGVFFGAARLGEAAARLGEAAARRGEPRVAIGIVRGFASALSSIGARRPMRSGGGAEREFDPRAR